MPGNLLNVPLHKMSQTADCLAACAAMVFDYRQLSARLAGDEQSLRCPLCIANQSTLAFSPWPSPWARPTPSSSWAKRPTGWSA
jgi:hypothetical protein